MNNKIIRANKIESYINNNNFNNNFYNDLLVYLNKCGIILQPLYGFGFPLLRGLNLSYENKLILFTEESVTYNKYKIAWILDSKYDEDYLLNLIIRFNKLQCFS